MADIVNYEIDLRTHHMSNGDSVVHNFDGSILKKVSGRGEVTIKGPIDLTALRRVRAEQFHPVTIRAEMYAKEYEQLVGWPNNGFAAEPIKGIEETRAVPAPGRGAAGEGDPYRAAGIRLNGQ